MSQRLMLTALKSARLNGVPFGGEKKRKKREREEAATEKQIKGRVSVALGN